jgi:hypothetical protein
MRTLLAVALLAVGQAAAPGSTRSIVLDGAVNDWPDDPAPRA